MVYHCLPEFRQELFVSISYKRFWKPTLRDNVFDNEVCRGYSSIIQGCRYKYPKSGESINDYHDSVEIFREGELENEIHPYTLKRSVQYEVFHGASMLGYIHTIHLFLRPMPSSLQFLNIPTRPGHEPNR